MIEIRKHCETYISVTTNDRGITKQFAEHFTFKVPGYQFMPKYKRGLWTGDIQLYNQRTGLIYFGLLTKVVEFCSTNDYRYTIDSNIQTDINIDVDKVTKQICESITCDIQPRDYQITAILSAIRANRRLLVSPTGSGKSLVIYALQHYYNAKTLIIVPSTALCSQLAGDFIDYNSSYTDCIHKIYDGNVKQTDKRITIATWQSLYKQPKEFFDQFDCTICDEAHLAKASSITSIMEKLNNCKYKFGLTGSLDGTQTNMLVLQGLFGPVYEVTTTSKLIEQKHLANFSIKCITLDYDDTDKQLCKTMSYGDELDMIISNTKRNKLISKLACSVEGNTLVLFQFVEKHGKVLYDMISQATDRPVYFIHGKIGGDERDNMRKIVEQQDNAIIVASVQTFSTGINIKSLKNIIFSSPSKSRIRTLQSIGRVLRRSETKTDSILYDIADNLTWKSRKNYTLQHFIERVKIYTKENFPYKLYTIRI